MYIKLVTYEDVLDAGRHLEAIATLEALTGEVFVRYRDLSGTRMPFEPLEGNREALLGAHVGAGFHQTARFRVESDGPALRSLELNAGLHPYSGVYTTLLEARLDARFVASRRAAFVALFDDWVARLTPITAHAHDCDDDALQNIANPRLAELGYGRAMPAEPERRPGREAVRGQFRYATTWLSHYGREALAVLGEPGADLGEFDVREVRDGVTIRLVDDPSSVSEEQLRALQVKLRAALALDAMVARDRRNYAYWKKKQ